MAVLPHIQHDELSGVFPTMGKGNNITPIQINNPLGELTIGVQPNTNILSSTYNRVLTVDVYDPAAINVTATARKS
jgi:hypothetical protein